MLEQWWQQRATQPGAQYRWLLLAAGVVGACGARSELKEGYAEQGTGGRDPSVECTEDAHCLHADRCRPLRCVNGTCQLAPPVVCDDGDACTTDECVPATGECVFTGITPDLDGDGHHAPRPGFVPGEPEACGDDCDDTSAAAYPGGEETCDGVDNDCNGVIDDGFRFEPIDNALVQVSDSSYTQAGVGGLAYNGAAYGITYAAQSAHFANFFQALSSTGATVVPEQSITNVGSDAYSGPLVWTGSVYATVWEDRRDDDYEIYFNRLDSDGRKLGPDLRVSYAEDFSLHPALEWNGAEFVVVWQDRRDGELFQIFGQRVNSDGALVGGNVPLSDLEWNAEGVSLARGDRDLGLAFKVDEDDGRYIAFRRVTPELTDLGPRVVLSSEYSVGAVAVWAQDRYVVAWHKRNPDTIPGDAIWGAAVSPDGTVLVPERRLTFGATFARSKNLLSLGDRILLVWADAGPDGNYELYSKLLTQDLDELTPRSRLTFDDAETTAPIPAFGPDGQVGILFQDRRTGAPQVYFTYLTCRAGSIG